MKTYVVIVNYRTAHLTLQCLASLEAERNALGGGQVLVVDNDSQDGSIAVLDRALSEKGWRAWVEIIPMHRNGGFSFGNNAGIRRAHELNGGAHAHILLLNPDTVVHLGCLAAAFDFLERNTDAGIVGVPIRDELGVLQCSAHRSPSPVSELLDQAKLGVLSRLLAQYDVSPAPALVATRCDWVSGAFFLIRAETVAQVGAMDEGYFLYFEEVDYCHRAALQGWQVWLAPTPGIVHLEGASTGIGAPRTRRPAYWFASRRRYFRRTRGVAGLLLADLLSLAGRCSFLVRKTLRAGKAVADDRQPLHYHRDLLLGDLRSLLAPGSKQ